MYGKSSPAFPRKVICGRTRQVFLVRERGAQAPRSQDTSQLSLLAQLKPAWLAMKAFGLLPIFSAQPAADSGRRAGHSVMQAAYAAGFYLIFAALILKKAFEIKREYFSTTYVSQVRLIFALMYSELLVPHLLIGPLHWASMGQILHFVRDWDAFQTRFLTVTRHPLRLDMSRRSALVVTSVVVGSLALCYFFSWFVMEEGDYVGTAVFMYSNTQINLLLAVWTLLCNAIAKAADELAMRFQKEFKVGAVGDHVVPGYHRVWLRLSQLTRDIGTMFSSVFNVIVMFWLTQMLLSAFQGTVLLANDCNSMLFLGVATFALADLISILIFCHAANVASDSVRDNFMSSLVMIDVDTNDVHKQLHALELAVGTHAPVISLGGFYDVNRSLIVSIMAAFTTFLVVLFQSKPTSEIDPCGDGVTFVNATT